MKHTTFSLSIPEPCTENWAQMTPCEKGRFCSNCQKTVVDFTGYTNAELAAFFSGRETESICGRFYVHQIENKVFSYTAPVKRTYRTLAMAASVAALTVLSFTADAQEATREVPVIPPMTVGVNALTSETSTSTFMIEGVVKDESGELLLSATVKIYSNNKLIGAASTDLDGYYNISPLQLKGSDTIQIQCYFVPYETVEVSIAASEMLDTTKVDFMLKRMNGTSIITKNYYISGLIQRDKPPLINKNNTGSNTITPPPSIKKIPR
jgi:hypothetical protein